MSDFSSDSDEGLRQLREMVTNEFLDCFYRVERLEERRAELNGDPPPAGFGRLIPLETPEQWETATKLLRDRVENLEKDIR
jgi:hypothetical protein